MVADAFTHVRTWVFDLDNTLYPPEIRLFDQIDRRMTDYVMRTLGLDRASADRLRRSYWRDYGTTLAGLMIHHGVDPVPYLVEVHEIDFSVLTPYDMLRAGIARLPGRRVVYTNGSAPYAQRVIEARGADRPLRRGLRGRECGLPPEAPRRSLRCRLRRRRTRPEARRVYAKTVDEVAAFAGEKARQGFTTLGHLNPFLDEPEEQPYFLSHAGLVEMGLETVRRCREAAGPSVDLMLELHRRLTPAEALTFADAVAEYRPGWLEDPIRPENIDAMA